MSNAPHSVTAVIVAAGRGVRAGGDLPKQWQHVAGKPVIAWTLERFLSHPQVTGIVLVTHPDDAARVSALNLPGTVITTDGGETRAASVQNGLRAAQDGIVLIHDVARPCVSDQIITDVIAATQNAGAAAPALQVTDALWQGDTYVTGTQDRAGLLRAQTPQGFVLAKILKAHQQFQGVAADDVEVACTAGLDVKIVSGDESNLKITTPNDFVRAAKRLETSIMDVRTGNGFDVHRFGEGAHVMLCGVSIPHDRGLQGHSDADVGLHTITDAIYGALAEGDIGQHFPPSDPQWKGAESHIFLTHAVELAATRGFAITHVDCTLICEFPKIGPHTSTMRAKLQELLNIDVDRISVKATTSERLGFTGRGEGIACMATATLVKS
ncbi:bifunctional 2-C-methyl-D-erythritol 4-phosphate cytidylyltransferase/2-C-methyl-D-erythritol 2,4-cyclodiphosphate synthase [uncultured Litoreibacter sp.]|uniref:bifunctional 2-C-methyl-D-erythritol 4-phosphate cytidylyltransferase/2-C-methyl-D-erythritol 2,4-cyclodiphosphate synthase n=1 Tax=uncultured Litoreibacter sp. TaxID=1392394 RepID=UPI0026127C36|nr:bifunctional 2-C-methyl-D-erythritol 4-phosphate cytidylyltransferase/2-C-methyl-D-erythritol 2,4-cyclodiphosphate synthase [uncultured Litoreibacter sp.]